MDRIRESGIQFARKDLFWDSVEFADRYLQLVKAAVPLSSGPQYVELSHPSRKADSTAACGQTGGSG